MYITHSNIFFYIAITLGNIRRLNFILKIISLNVTHIQKKKKKKREKDSVNNNVHNDSSFVYSNSYIA